MRPERERLRLAEVAGWQSMKKGVLARWSRLKREQAERKDSPPLEEAAAGAPLPAASDAGADAQEEFNTVRLQDYPTSRPSPTSPTSRRSWRKASRRRSATKRSRSSGARTRCWPILDAARETPPPEVAREYRALFEGLPEAKLMPYASHYLTGKLIGRPLAELRITMAHLGLAPNDDAREPEDHIGSVLEVMAGLILGSFGDGPATLPQQRQFFDAHVATWIPAFFGDLKRVAEGGFYARVAILGRGFVGIEREAFEMLGPGA